MTREDTAAVSQIEAMVCVAPWNQKLFSDCIEVGYHCWVMEHEQQVIGYYITSYAADESHLLNIAIHPDFQGKGLGHRLMDKVLFESRQANTDTLFLEVRESNQTAIGLYQKLGFVEVGRRQGYYQHPVKREDAIVMALPL